MAAVGNVFHVEFGINETRLTRALEEQDWSLAERIIAENSRSSFLNEGCYRRIPLFITLSGIQDGWHLQYMPRNLYIARLLIQNGADVNYRIPETCFGSEYMNPGHSALELVICFYIQVTAGPGNRWNPSQEPVIGLYGQLVTQYDELLDQLCDLVFIILGHGGDPNIQDENHMTVLHRLLLNNGDIHLIKLICDNGADLNALDAKGNTPLNSLCEGCEDIVINIDDTHSGINMEYLQYMISQKEVQVDHQNRYGCTALFHCMLRGEFQAAACLLENGCDVTLCGKLYRAINTRPISPLLAALSSPEIQDKKNGSDVADVADADVQMKPAYTHYVAHLVDAGYFTQNQILDELEVYMRNETVMSNTAVIFPYNQSHLTSLGPHLINMMFGGSTTSLRQLCVRTIFRSCFFRDALSSHQCLDLPMFSIEMASEETLTELISLLNIPKDLLVNFQVEMFRQKLCSHLQSCALVLHDNAIFGNINSDSDADSDLEQDESDLEYW